MRSKILDLLSNSSEYVSGQMLCDTFGVSRTAVWKVIRQLREEGYGIEAVNNRGYKLVKRPDKVDAESINAVRKSVWAAGHVIYAPVMDSTNRQAKLLAEEGAAHGTLVVTEKQMAGRGRRGRNWHSPEGSGIWMSLILRPEIMPVNASMLTLVAAMAVYDGIKRRIPDISIKWPNDIIAGGKKLCGILTEMSAQPDAVNYVVIGIGINVKNTAFPEEIAGIATSIELELEGQQGHVEIDRSSLIADIMAAFEDYYDMFIRTEDLSGMKELYNSRLVNLGRRVVIEERGVKYEGVAEGIDDQGCLVVTKDNGEKTCVVSGEVSVRGVLGYV